MVFNVFDPAATAFGLSSSLKSLVKKEAFVWPSFYKCESNNNRVWSLIFNTVSFSNKHCRCSLSQAVKGVCLLLKNMIMTTPNESSFMQ